MVSAVVNHQPRDPGPGDTADVLSPHCCTCEPSVEVWPWAAFDPHLCWCVSCQQRSRPGEGDLGSVTLTLNVIQESLGAAHGEAPGANLAL